MYLVYYNKANAVNNGQYRRFLNIVYWFNYFSVQNISKNQQILSHYTSFLVMVN